MDFSWFPAYPSVYNKNRRSVRPGPAGEGAGFFDRPEASGAMSRVGRDWPAILAVLGALSSYFRYVRRPSLRVVGCVSRTGAGILPTGLNFLT